ncbi:hypothetical protein L227DRAFT_137997 [Lentinus tigrinus ALCF2SS1-6]|uniref:Uncharacterized protein n=1 Tax=Lentinus tigrinus ALCF2SS1-6 TaxID=1328759 RepID=A0A5C2SRF7_9APHY|nr:hypothetical protein L227DRAFT_137997 [Lentinus tigrinus ALCF2SS1-6]
MTSRHRTTSSSRKDTYGQWRPSDSDSDQPRQTMATTQRHNVDQIVGVEAPRKHRSSRRAEAVDPQDPSTSYSRHHHKSSSRDRSSSAQQASYYAVPPSPNSSQYQTQDVYYDLRAHLDLKKKTDKRSPRSREKALAGDEVKASRSGHRSSRQAYRTTAQYAQSITQAQAYPQPIVPPQPYAVPTQATRDPTSSSRHHREREKDREKAGSKDRDVRTRDPTETREEREKRKRREKDGEKERSSKDKERHREKDRHKDREARTAVETQPADAASAYYAYAQTTATAQRSTDKIPVPYPDYTRPAQLPTSAYPPSVAPVAMPWSGLTSASRGAAAPAPEPTYPYASDKEDPPLPIPPPERRRERTSSKPHRSHHHKVSSQQAGQDSGLSSSEQERHSVLERTDIITPGTRQASFNATRRASSSVGTLPDRRAVKMRKRPLSKRNGANTGHMASHPAISPRAPVPTFNLRMNLLRAKRLQTPGIHELPLLWTRLLRSSQLRRLCLHRRLCIHQASLPHPVRQILKRAPCSRRSSLGPRRLVNQILCRRMLTRLPMVKFMGTSILLPIQAPSVRTSPLPRATQKQSRLIPGRTLTGAHLGWPMGINWPYRMLWFDHPRRRQDLPTPTLPARRLDFPSQTLIQHSRPVDCRSRTHARVRLLHLRPSLPGIPTHKLGHPLLTATRTARRRERPQVTCQADSLYTKRPLQRDQPQRHLMRLLREV